MKRCFPRLFLVLLVWIGFPQRSPAPLYPAEGWRYETPGSEGNWIRATAKEQFELAQSAYNQKKYDLAIKCCRRIATHERWHLGDYGQPAQYLLGLCYEAKGWDEDAFEAYQKLLELYPKIDNYDEVSKRQFVIANRFLGGQRFPLKLFGRKVFGYFPLYRSMEKTIALYDKIIKNGPYSQVAPYAQMNIGLAWEFKKGLLPDPENMQRAAKSYKTAADRYSDQKIGIDAMYREAQTYGKQARRAEYDQSIAGQAIATYTDFIALHPEDPRIPEAQKAIDAVKSEQARGSFAIARFYEKKRCWQGALIYYNEVLLKDPNSNYATIARQRMDAINKKRTAAS